MIGAKADVIDFNAFKEETFPKHKLAIIVVATHYEGDPCDNTRNFYKWFKKLLKSAGDKPFNGMNFTIFGLGDTSYEQYNEMGNQFDAGFEKLGASRIFDAGVGNAETFSTESDFATWKESLWTKVCEHYAKFDTADNKKAALTRRASIRKNPDALPWLIAESGQLLEEPAYDMNMRNYTSSNDLPIKDMKELRQQPGEWGASTLLVSFDLANSGLSYKTAANFAIYASNNTADVELFAKQHKLNLDQKIVFQKNPDYTGRAAKVPFPTGEGISMREALTKFIDLTGILSIKTLEALIPMCEAKADKAV